MSSGISPTATRALGFDTAYKPQKSGFNSKTLVKIILFVTTIFVLLATANVPLTEAKRWKWENDQPEIRRPPEMGRPPKGFEEMQKARKYIECMNACDRIPEDFSKLACYTTCTALFG